MKHLRLGTLVATFLSLSIIGGCSDSNNTPASSDPPPPPPPTFSYSIEGAAVKGIISSATVSLRDADSNVIAGATATTDSDGSYSISFSMTTQLETPLQVVVDGDNAMVICDVEPNCEVGVDANDDPIAVGFGEMFALPDGFVLRAPIQSLESSGTNSFESTAFVSPLSEFVTAAALSMDGSQTLTDANLDIANEQVATLLRTAFPTLDIPQDMTIATIPLLDLTDLENVDSEALNELSIASTAMSAALAGFVDVGSSSRGDITRVLNDFVARFSGGNGDLKTHDAALLRQGAVNGVARTAMRLTDLVESNTVTLPAGFTVAGLTAIQQAGADALPEIVDIWTNLTPHESTAPVDSDAMGWADLIVLLDSGEAKVSLETDGIDVTAVHLHEGYGGQNGPILVHLQQDAGNPDRWEFVEDTVLDADTLDAIMAGRTYFNVHSDAFPAGEIRGQVLPPGIEMILTTPTGLEQVPVPIESDGFARGAITLDTETHVAQVHFTSMGIEIIAAHVHQGIAGTNGGVVIDMQQNPQSMNHWFADDADMTDLLDALSGARLYFNLHTLEHQPGELRGQIVPLGHTVRISHLMPDQVVADMPVDSAASGVAATTLVMATGDFYIHVNTLGIVDPLSVRLYSGDAGANGTMLFELLRDDLNPDHWSVHGQTLSAEELMMFIDDELYIEVRTAAWPQGEIRGQLTDASIVVDTDGDGTPDMDDAFPSDPNETADSDMDGVGDNADAFPNDANETADTDGDGVGDNADAFPNNSAETTDSDGDGTGDNADQCPNDPSGTVDSDNDGICDSSQPPADSDGDGVPDDQDAFPNDPGETADSDSDGVGDNADAFPNDANETADTDGDGVGDNADAFPNDANETADTDNDGVGDNADAFPQDATESADADSDGVGDNGDNCPNTANADQTDGDGDGVGDACDTASTPTYTQVQAIFNSRCVFCHGVSGGLSLQSSGSFSNLVNVSSSQIPTLDRVEPGDPDNSYLVWKIEGRSGIVGARMPLGGILSPGDIDLIRDWIAAGANND